MVAPRVYHGEYTLQETVILTQLNLNMQARDLERMGQIVEKPRGDLEKVLPREDLKPRDVPKANPRAQPEDLPWEYPEAFRFSRGGTFFRYHPRLFHNLSDFGFLEVQGSLPRDHYGKILVNPQ
jgi:hypothetical protein